MTFSKGIHCDIPFAQPIAFSKNNLFTPTHFTVSLKEKIIATTSAVFEGVGISGIVSAALWYTTAPSAPDGFTGPISTLTITSSAIASLLIAIPIAYIAYKKMMNELEKFYADLILECRALRQNREELIFDLLRLRVLFDNDHDYGIVLQSLLESLNKPFSQSTVMNICELFRLLKKKRFLVKWQTGKTLTANLQEHNTHIDAKPFVTLLKDNHLANNRIFRKTILNYIQKIFSHKKILIDKNLEQRLKRIKQPKSPIKRKTNFAYGIIAGITCSEVLLSIGWTVFSILIGVNVIAPISEFSWTIYAFICLALGCSFGFGIGLNKQQQKNNLLLKDDISHCASLFTKLNNQINDILTQKILEQEKQKSAFKPKLTLIKKKIL